VVATAAGRSPWEPTCIFANFGHEIVCGDSWGNLHLVVATAAAGTFLIGHQKPPVSEVLLQYKVLFVRSGWRY
jgi:hypothetical protein